MFENILCTDCPVDVGDSIVLPNGTPLRIRALRRGDERPIRELDTHLTVRSRHLRFLSPLRTLPDSLVRLLACADDGRSVALFAELEGRGRDVLGLASFAAIDEGVAELGLVVRDDWQRRRVGTELATRILTAAENRGLHRFVAHVSADNVAIRHVLRNVGKIVATTVRGNMWEVRFVRRRMMPAAWRMG